MTRELVFDAGRNQQALRAHHVARFETDYKSLPVVAHLAQQLSRCNSVMPHGAVQGVRVLR